MQFNKDTFQIVCSFLSARDLTRLRHLSRLINVWTSEYVMSKCKTCELEELACPMCGGWVSTKNLNMWNGFFDVFNERESNERLLFIQNSLFPSSLIITRQTILCEDCEYDEKECLPTRLRFSGSRRYEFFVNSEYALIYRTSNDSTIIWNQFRVIVPP